MLSEFVVGCSRSPDRNCSENEAPKMSIFGNDFMRLFRVNFVLHTVAVFLEVTGHLAQSIYFDSFSMLVLIAKDEATDISLREGSVVII